MREQLDLLLAPTHSNDPATSALAAAKVDVRRQFDLVLAVLANAGDEGLTDDDIAARAGLLRHAAGTRRGVARNLGLVESCGRGRSALNNPAMKWRLTAEGREVAAQIRRSAA